MDFLPLFLFIALLIYFIIKRIEEKKKENFDDRDN